MPHIILEVSDNIKEDLELKRFFYDIHQVLVDYAGAKLDSCKSRLRRESSCYIGNGEPNNAFMHLKIFLLSGREKEVKHKISKKAFDLMTSCFKSDLRFEDLNLQISVQVEDMDRKTYTKN